MTESTLFRQHHFFKLLDQFNPNKGPLDLYVSLYVRHNHQLGSKDRLFVVDRIYKYFRWKGLLEGLLDQQGLHDEARRLALAELLEQDPLLLSSQANLPPHVRVSFPAELYGDLLETYGDDVDSVCLACNEPAPITIRANSLKTTREELIAALQGQGIDAQEDPSTPYAIRIVRRVNMCALPEFQAGLFEIQDAGSQLVANLVDGSPGDSVLDFCAGAGGKTLAFAPKLHNRGQIFLHDIRLEALFEAKRRLRRAGIQNAQTILHTDERRLSLLKGNMDWVLVDVPCSGTGTLRRNPDQKWKYSYAMRDRLIEEQKAIVAEACSYVKPHGRLVYATCSLLRKENEEQCEYFSKTHSLTAVGEPFRSCPKPLSMDGFFAVVFQRQ